MSLPQFRQGDVLVQRIAELPRGSKPLPRMTGRVVLAEGEATGHAHAIAAAGATLYEAKDGSLTLVVSEAPALLVHEEHSGIVLEVGVYRVIRQREYRPEETQYVSD